MRLSPDGELHVSQEWRALDDVPSFRYPRIPVNLATLSEHVDVKRIVKLDDTSAPELDHKVRFFARSLGTRSLLLVPVFLDEDMLGLTGFHQTPPPPLWFDLFVTFLQPHSPQLVLPY